MHVQLCFYHVRQVDPYHRVGEVARFLYLSSRAHGNATTKTITTEIPKILVKLLKFQKMRD